MASRAPAPVHPLPDALVDLVAQRFRALGEPMRIRLLDHLRDGPATVTDLQQALDSSQQNVSKHLSILHGVGLVARQKTGTSVVYEIDDPTVFDLCDIVCGGVRQRVAALDALLQG